MTDDNQMSSDELKCLLGFIPMAMADTLPVPVKVYWLKKGTWFPSNRYGHVNPTKLFSGRSFMNTEQVLACVHQKGFQTFVEVDAGSDAAVEAFRAHIVRDKGFGWTAWTQFLIYDPNIDYAIASKAPLIFAFQRERDAVDFRLRWE